MSLETGKGKRADHSESKTGCLQPLRGVHYTSLGGRRPELERAGSAGPPTTAGRCPRALTRAHKHGQGRRRRTRKEKKALPNFRACIHKEGERVCIKCGRAQLQEVAWDLASLPCPLPECSAVPGCVCSGTEPQAKGLTRQTLTLSQFRRPQVQNQGTSMFSGW